MEAQKLKTKKKAISKKRIKKTIKNVISRPDSVFWPIIIEREENIIQIALKKHSVYIPLFQKPHWKDVKLIPKNERPKPPKIPKVEGLIFGLSECYKAVKTQICTAVLLEANINPQVIAQPIIEACTSSNTSVLCIKDLRQISFTNFGINTSCLGIKKDYLQDLSNNVQEIYQNYKYVKKSEATPVLCTNIETIDNGKRKELQMDVDSYCLYVYRTNKKSRAFVPENTRQDTKVISPLTGQDYIKVSQDNNSKSESKAYMKMILKKISNNPNRIKVKHKSLIY